MYQVIESKFRFKCRYCGKEFESSRRNRAYCSAFCHDKDGANRLRYSKGRSKRLVEPNRKKLSVEEAAYLAGFIDGEGTISLYKDHPRRGKSTYRPVVEASGTNWFLLNKVREFAGNGYISLCNKNRLDKHKPGYKWMLTPSEIEVILPQIMPYLIGKKRQAEIVMEYFSIPRTYITKYAYITHPDELKRLEGLVEELRLLNKRGKIEFKT